MRIEKKEFMKTYRQVFYKEFEEAAAAGPGMPIGLQGMVGSLLLMSMCDTAKALFGTEDSADLEIENVRREMSVKSAELLDTFNGGDDRLIEIDLSFIVLAGIITGKTLTAIFMKEEEDV